MTVNGRTSAWFRGAQARDEAHIQAGGIDKDVRRHHHRHHRQPPSASRYPPARPNLHPRRNVATVKHIKLRDLHVSRIGLGCMGMSHAYTGAGSDDAESIRTTDQNWMPMIEVSGSPWPATSSRRAPRCGPHRSWDGQARTGHLFLGPDRPIWNNDATPPSSSTPTTSWSAAIATEPPDSPCADHSIGSSCISRST